MAKVKVNKKKAFDEKQKKKMPGHMNPFGNSIPKGGKIPKGAIKEGMTPSKGKKKKSKGK